MDPMLKTLVLLGTTCVAEAMIVYFITKKMGWRTWGFWFMMAIIFTNLALMYAVALKGE